MNPHASTTEYLLVNFGGPRDLSEISSFLTELLLDPDVIAPKLPSFIHRPFFRRIAKKRALTISADYEKIGGSSPIFFDTENIAKLLSEKLKKQVFTFHRYLPKTHEASLKRLETSKATTIKVLPLFPQFSYATTGSIARFLEKNLSQKTKTKLQWIRSFPEHPEYVKAFQTRIRSFLEKNHFLEEETLLLFSAHGLPEKFIEKGDPYQKECEGSYKAIRSAFPNALTLLSYQSKFGRGEWVKPYTSELSENILNFCEKRKQIIFIPLSFTSDHIETLFEVEYQYLPPIRKQNLRAERCPALNLEPYWIETLKNLFLSDPTFSTSSLIKK